MAKKVKITKSTKDDLVIVEKLNETLADIRESFVGINNLTRELTKNISSQYKANLGVLTSLTTTEAIQSRIKELHEFGNKAILSKINFSKELLLAQENQNEALKEYLLNHEGVIQNLNEEIKQAKIKNELQEKYVNNLGKIHKTLKDYKDTIAAIDTSIATGIVLTKLRTVANDIVESFINIKKESGLSASNIASMSPAIGSSYLQTLAYGASLKEISATAMALSDEFGTINYVTTDMATAAVKLHKWYNLSTKDASTIQRLFKQTATHSNMTAKELQQSTIEAANLAGVLPAGIFRDMAASAEDIAKWSNSIDPGLIKSSITARQLGIHLSTVSKIGEGLLDIETSITKEMEASVLLGRQLNLSKAREYALAGDTKKMTESIVNQLGSVNEFNKLNIIQRQALAESIGVSVDELSKMIHQQGELNKHTGKYNKFIDDTSMILKGMSKHFSKENLMFISSLSLLIKNTTPALGKLINAIPVLNKLGPGLSTLAKKIPGVNKIIGNLAKNTTALNKADPTPGIKSIQNIGASMTDMLKGAASMAIVATSLFILGKALHEFEDLNWETMGRAGASLAALTGAVLLLGLAKGPVLAGAGALAILAGSIGAVSLAFMGFAQAEKISAQATAISSSALADLASVTSEDELKAISRGIASVGGTMAMLGAMSPYIMAAAIPLAAYTKILGSLAASLTNINISPESYNNISAVSSSLIELTNNVTEDKLNNIANGLKAIDEAGRNMNSINIRAQQHPIITDQALTYNEPAQTKATNAVSQVDINSSNTNNINSALLSKLDKLISISNRDKEIKFRGKVFARLIADEADESAL